MEKHLKHHFRFAEIANGKIIQNQNLIKDIDRSISFRDLLRLQIAPMNPQNVTEVDSLCRMIIKSQLRSTARVRDKVYDAAMRAGTKIYDKGKNIGKKGLMAGLHLISKSNVGGAKSSQDAQASE